MIDESAMASVFQTLGEEGLTRVVASFYRRVPTDNLLGPMYPSTDLAAAEERLREFLIFRFGGPARYVEKQGHPRLRMRHASFGISTAVRDRWVALMDHAIDEAKVPAAIAATMREFLHGTATMLINSGE